MTELLSKVAVPFCIPIGNEWEFLLLHILASIWCCQCSGFCSGFCSALIGVQAYIVVFIWISLMIDDVAWNWTAEYKISHGSWTYNLFSLGHPILHYTVPLLFRFQKESPEGRTVFALDTLLYYYPEPKTISSSSERGSNASPAQGCLWFLRGYLNILAELAVSFAVLLDV